MKKISVLAITILVVVTVILAGYHLSQQEQIEWMVIRSGDETVTLYESDLNQENFAGSLTNGKGEVSQYEYRGIELKALLDKKRITLSDTDTIQVTSADNYTASFTAEEVLSDRRVYIAIEIDGEAVEGMNSDESGVQLIVFGDKNSKRCVRNAKMIEICH